MTSSPDRAVTIRTTYTWIPGGRSVLTTPGSATVLPAGETLTGLVAMQGAALHALNKGPVAFDATPPEPVADLLESLLRLGALRMRVGTVESGGDEAPLYSIQTFRGAPSGRPSAFDGADPVVSRFTVLRRTDDSFVAENPLSWCDIEFHDADAVGVLAGISSAEHAWTDRLWADAQWARHAVPAGSETADFPTASWSPHELWFHRRSTVGDRGSSWSDFGPTRWAEGSFEPVPSAPEPYPGDEIPLPKPDLDDVRDTDAPLAAVMEDRVSTRSFDDEHPMTIEALGHLLYRCARTRGTRVIEKPGEVRTELPSKPYPSGGSIYELELYPVIRTVTGLEPGMYHYDSIAHTLRPVAAFDDPAVQRLLAPAALTLADNAPPQAMLVLAARAGRIMWTYEQMPYAVILKHVGVLTQSLYLTATALGLGGLAQGYGDTAAFAEATGRDELVECAVGTFVLGSPR